MPATGRVAVYLKMLSIAALALTLLGCFQAMAPGDGDDTAAADVGAVPNPDTSDTGTPDGGDAGNGGPDTGGSDTGSGGGNDNGNDDTIEPHEADPPGSVDSRFAKLKEGGFWNGFWTGSPSKLSDDAEGFGVNQERNATIRWLGGVAGFDQPDAYLDEGRIRFRVKVNADGLETGGGGKHLINLASTALSRGRRDNGPVTRVEIANPGDENPRFVLHNYVGGDDRARDLGNLPIHFEPGQWVDIDWSWRFAGGVLHMTLNGQSYEVELLPGSEGPGRYWGSGHMETPSGGGAFTFGRVTISRD